VPISFSLSDKNILVTGASSGIGQAIACYVAEAGATVLLSGRNIDRLNETALLCGKRAIICPQDLTDVEALPKFVRKLARDHGPLSGLVHSAGIEQSIPLRALRAQKIQEIMSLNSISGVMLIKGLAMRGCHTKKTSVIVISSITGHNIHHQQANLFPSQIYSHQRVGI